MSLELYGAKPISVAFTYFSVHNLLLQHVAFIIHAQGVCREMAGVSLHEKHTIRQFHDSKMSSFRVKPKKSTLGQFHPEKPLRGRRISYIAMACIAGSFILNSVLGWVAGVLLASAAVVLGKIGLDSEGRGLALVALILGIVLIGVLLTVLFIGSENIGM